MDDAPDFCSNALSIGNIVCLLKSGAVRPRIFPLLILAFLLFASAFTGVASDIKTETSDFNFTNLASQLLRTQLGLQFDHIQLYPTNQYNAAVHRFLQVSVNLVDAKIKRTGTAYEFVPLTFRPLFRNDNGFIYISGYAEVTNTSLLGAPMRDLADPSDRAALQQDDLIYGVPIVVGARKGFPNFNEFAMETSVSVLRKLQFKATVPRDPKFIRPFQTNQMYVVDISNVFGMEAWNAYSNAYPRPLRLIVDADVITVLTNELGRTLLTNHFTLRTNQNFPACGWGGFQDANHASNSIQILFTPSTSHFLSLSNSTYRHAGDFFGPFSELFESNQNPPFSLPIWWLDLSTRLRFVLVDEISNRIVDYVNLVSADPPINITANLMQGAECSENYNPSRSGIVPSGLFWCTNRDTPLGPTFGERLQMDVSAGLFAADWKSSRPVFPGIGLNDQIAAIDFFRTNFFGWPPAYGSRGNYLTNVFYSPFNPLRTLYITTSWSANDPFVHYTPEDLQDLSNINRVRRDNSFSQSKLSNIGRVNDRYRPWGAALSRPSTTVFDISIKDPLIWRADDWDFPDANDFSVNSLGRIHRGTPWQTLYLKSAVANQAQWSSWVGFSDGEEAMLTHPTNDWHLVSLLIPILMKEHPHQLVSVNQATDSDWESVLKNLQVLTNGLEGTQTPLQRTLLKFDTLLIHPKAPQIQTIINDINRTRTSMPSQIWGDRGDILATPALSLASPWLRLDRDQVLWGITDEVYEKIPSQILQLLRSDSIGSVGRGRAGVRLQFTSIPANRYIVEASSDLINWRPVYTNSARDSIMDFDDHSATNSHIQFYRSVLLP